jgi:hypothetical protein
MEKKRGGEQKIRKLPVSAQHPARMEFQYTSHFFHLQTIKNNFLEISGLYFFSIKNNVQQGQKEQKRNKKEEQKRTNKNKKEQKRTKKEQKKNKNEQK